jgi:hypothetical protein
VKVLEESGRGVEPGDSLSIEDLRLPVRGGRATLVVFWKRL